MKMFLVNLKWAPASIRTIEVEIKVCKKTAWAIERNARRHLIGSSVFQTPAAAERCRTALLVQLAESKGLRWKFPGYYQQIQHALQATLH